MRIARVRLLLYSPQLFAIETRRLGWEDGALRSDWSLLTCVIGKRLICGKRRDILPEMLSAIASNYLSALGFCPSHIAKESLLMILVTDHVRGNWTLKEDLTDAAWYD